MMVVNYTDMQYFYKQGHNQQLSQTEFEFLTDSKIEQKNNDWFFSDKYLPANRTGSVVYVGEIIESFAKDSGDKIVLDRIESEIKKISEIGEIELEYPEFKDVNIAKIYTQDATEMEIPQFDKEDVERGLISRKINIGAKKIGFVVPENLQQASSKVAKINGFKKISFGSFSRGVNFGNWKRTSNWLITFKYNDQLVLGRILSFANQEFWSDIDNKLPHLDMKRGVINLKLARTLMNLTSSKNVLDPFAGQGRVLVAGMDIKSNILASDLDNMEKDIAENLEKASKLWYNNHLILNTRVNKSNLLKINSEDSLSVVTEGYLGTNFRKYPSDQEMKDEWDKQFKLWKKVLSSAENNKVKELVFCLPFYKTAKGVFTPDELLKKLASVSEYKFVKLGKQNHFILYSRADTITGHLVVKMIKG